MHLSRTSKVKICLLTLRHSDSHPLLINWGRLKLTKTRFKAFRTIFNSTKPTRWCYSLNLHTASPSQELPRKAKTEKLVNSKRAKSMKEASQRMLQLWLPTSHWEALRLMILLVRITHRAPCAKSAHLSSKRSMASGSRPFTWHKICVSFSWLATVIVERTVTTRIWLRSFLASISTRRVSVIRDQAASSNTTYWLSLNCKNLWRKTKTSCLKFWRKRAALTCQTSSWTTSLRSRNLKSKIKCLKMWWFRLVWFSQ